MTFATFALANKKGQSNQQLAWPQVRALRISIVRRARVNPITDELNFRRQQLNSQRQ
jgi:hypothetical protein